MERLLSRAAGISCKAKTEDVERYLYEKINEVKASTLLSRLDPLVVLAQRLGERPWKEATRDDVIRAIAGHTFSKGSHRARDPDSLPAKNLAASTKHQWAVHIHTFYKWLLELDKDEVPPQCRSLPFKKKEALAKRARELALEPTEVRQILSGARSTRDRFTVLFLIETGLRASEAAAVRLDGIERRNHGYWITLPSDALALKRGPREVAIPLICAAETYESWLAEHPRRHEARAPLLVTLSQRSHGNPMTGKTVSDIVVRCAKRAGMRHVHAHMLRHTSATLKIAKGMEPEAVRLLHGWTERSTMLSYYAHLKPHFERLVLNAHGLESNEPELLDIMGSQPCGLCGSKNRVEDATCRECGVRLSEAAQESERAHRRQHVLAYVANDAVMALRGVLFTAVARAMGWKTIAREATA